MGVVYSTPGVEICSALAKVLQRNNRIRQHTKLWYTTRTRMITCSDAAAVLGLNPYSSRKQVFKKKTGQSKPFKGNFATRRGNELEAVAMKAYEKKTGKVAWPEDIGLMQHLDHPVIGGSPDGITVDGILIEIKCPLSRKIVPGVVPPYYKPQLQILMEIFDLECAHFVQFRPATAYTEEELDVTVVPRDRAIFASWLPVLLDFMEEVFEFYDRVNLPVGTPMIDWEREDTQAFDKLQRELDIGIGKVCAFVDDPQTNRQVFVVEEYSGPGNPVKRTEYALSDYKEENEYTKDIQSLSETKGEDTVTFVDKIISGLPTGIRTEIANNKRKRDSSDEDDSANENTISAFDYGAVMSRIAAGLPPR